MAQEAVGLVIFSVNGQDYDCASYEVQHNTGVKAIPTMNRTQRIKFTSEGIKTWTLSVAVVIPDGKDQIQWKGIKDARISIESLTGNFRTTYVDCFVTEASESYSVEGETRRNLSLFALDELEESL
ncbi:hypothetical protein I9054_012185 [Acinetobacter bereziniae]|uniref:Uncharacterized protein n=1 Tax=Acinetobacter bereziniae TaxID=106648 RepID=A0A8I1AJX1_ACIBZ|nr:hypothetical protein [Acinetobacter bereziniae]QQC82996.1 hypothetical protein I9190_11765 [Acinetobacter bereziniae]UUN96144.1 hypothetical protein I9054_012185 [Acinetobacter bereziniae]